MHNLLAAYYGQSQADLPLQYRRVAWLRSTGTQYIDTDVQATQRLRLEINVAWDELGIMVMGLGSQGGKANRIAVGIDSAEGRMYTGIGSRNYYPGRTLVAGVRYRMAASTIDNSWELDDVSGTTSVSWVSNAAKLSLFTRSNNITDCPCKCTLYGASISNAAGLLREFVPAVRRADGVAGLYDRIGDNFYTNQGTGNFATP